MGRKSRLKRERAAAGTQGKLSRHREKMAAQFLQDRGTSLGPELNDYAAAARLDGHLWIRQRLLANHNIRMVACGRPPAEYLEHCWKPLRYLTFHYLGLRRAGYVKDPHPADYFGEWPDHVRWGLDSVQQSVRLLLCGQLIGASVVARNQLERWTDNRANNIGIRRISGESTAEFAGRVWKERSFDRMRFERAEPDDVIDGRRVLAEDVMNGLSRIIHAEQYAETVRWANQCFQDFPPEAVSAVRLVSDALVLVSRQLALAVATLLAEQGQRQAADAVATFRPPIPRVGITPVPGALLPANMLLIHGPALAPLNELAAKFDAVARGAARNCRRFNDVEMMLFCFSHYRARCVRHARSAFAAEEKILGRRLTQDHLSANELPPVVTSEMAASLASWLPDGSQTQAAAGAIADALRGSYWLWLEDDMRSMATLRVVLEQAARLRVWRLKPQHGPRLETDGTPARWLYKAGWARLSPLNRALGELSHYRQDVKWNAAFNLLVMLNPRVARDEAPLTARGHALEAVTRLVNREIREQVAALEPDVGAAFDAIAEELFVGGNRVDQQLDDYLNHVQTHRAFEFPQPSEWVGPSVAADIDSETGGAPALPDGRHHLS